MANQAAIRVKLTCTGSAVCSLWSTEPTARIERWQLSVCLSYIDSFRKSVKLEQIFPSQMACYCEIKLWTWARHNVCLVLKKYIHAVQQYFIHLGKHITKAQVFHTKISINHGCLSRCTFTCRFYITFSGLGTIMEYLGFSPDWTSQAGEGPRRWEWECGKGFCFKYRRQC